MAGNNNPQATNAHAVGDLPGQAYAEAHPQPGAVALTAPESISTSKDEPGGLFDFDALTSQYKIGIIKNGITKKQLEAIKSETDFDYHTLSNLLSVSRTTLIKKKGDEKFDLPTSERIMLLAELISFGREVFETRARFNIWLKKPSIALGDKMPLELLDTLYGIEEVKKELGRIEYGVY